jgi:hypothetical protein
MEITNPGVVFSAHRTPSYRIKTKLHVTHGLVADEAHSLPYFFLLRARVSAAIWK